MSRMQTNTVMTAMNQLSNHDHSRFLTRTNHKVGRAFQLGAESASQDVKKGIFREAVVIQMTWPGAPTLYYGDEPVCVDIQTRITDGPIRGETKTLSFCVSIRISLPFTKTAAHCVPVP